MSVLSNIQKEVKRIKKYINAQKKKYGERFLSSAVNPEDILTKYKTKSVQLKHLKELTSKNLKEKIVILDESTGEVQSLKETQRQTRSEAQIKSRKSRQAFWSGEENPSEEISEEYYPSKEEIEYNNLGEALASSAGEPWQYQEFSKANYNALREYISDELGMHGKQRYGDAYAKEHQERGGVVQRWLDALVERYGLDAVALMINDFAGQNSFSRESIFYNVGNNTEFIVRAMNYLPISQEERAEIFDKIVDSYD